MSGHSKVTAAPAEQITPRQQAFFDSLADGYYQTDLAANLLVVNRSLCEFLGIEDAAQVLNGGEQHFIDAANIGILRAASQRVLKTGRPANAVACVIRRPDGESRRLEVSISLLRDGATPVGFHGTVRDITASSRPVEPAPALRTTQSELKDLRAQYAQLSEIEQMKTHMIRVTAHDIRSPLSIIASYLELLDEDMAQHYTEVDLMYRDAIQQAVARIMQLTTDILSLERLNEHRDVTLMRVPLTRLLEKTLEEFSANSSQLNQKIVVNAEPLAVYGDSADLHEAIANLIGNAIKYTPENGTIEVRLRRDGDFAVLDIIDSGYGIPEELQQNLFQPFQRIKTRETHAIDGTGLGLYLVKKIIERHDGTVHFTSEYGKGSTFGFRLPLAKSGE